MDATHLTRSPNGGSRLSDERVVTLVGAGGIGKTSLAFAVADDVAAGFGDGVWLVELAGLQSGDALVLAAASAMGVQPRADMIVLESVITSFRDLEALVVLDNCEHVIDAAAEFATALVEGTSGLRVLATSREALAIGSELMVNVGPLDVPDNALPATPSPAVDLFVERARAVGCVIDISDNEALTTVGELCRRLAGLPLGIELAAARTRSLSPAEILQRLADHDLLATRRRDVPERHRTLTATIDWSHQLLDPAEQQLFDALSVFYSGFTLEAAENVCAREGLDASDIAELTSVLVERSMIEIVGRDAGTTRYSMLEPLRQFGSDRLSDEARRKLSDAHLAYYVALASDSSLGVKGPDEVLWVRRLGDEFSNLRVAQTHALATSQTQVAVALIVGLHDYAIWRQRFELGDWAVSALELPMVADEPQLPLLHATAGWGASIHCDYEAARTHAEAGLRAEQQPGAIETGWLHDVLAHSDYFSGDNARGVSHTLTEIDRARAGEDPYRLACVLGDGGIHLLIHGETELASDLIEEGFELAMQLECPNLIAMGHMGLSWLLLDDEPQAAREHSLTAIEVATDIECGTLIGLGARNLGMVAPEHGDPAADLERIVFGAELNQRAGDDARVRMIYQYCLPTTATVISSDQHADLVSLATALRRRPTQKVPAITRRLDATLLAARDSLGAGVYDQAVERGDTMTDDELTSLARSFYRSALEQTRA